MSDDVIESGPAAGGGVPIDDSDVVDVETMNPPHGASRRARRVRRWGIVVLLVLDVVMAAIFARRSSILLSTFHMDGAFQTLSGLLRIRHGFIPGRDFLPYLGIGPVLLMFPIFLLLGANLGASTFTAYLVTIIVFESVCGTLAVLVLRRRSAVTFAIGASSAALVLFLSTRWGHQWERVACDDCRTSLNELSQPGNSLRPIRAFASYALAIVSYLVLEGARWRPRRQALALGAVAGAVAALWSNDYGLASGGLVLVVLTVVGRWQRGWRRRELLTLWSSALASWLVAGVVATGGHLLDYLRYNLVDVRGDQYWYFGVVNSRVFSVGDFVRAVRGEHAVIAVVVLALLTALAARTRRIEHVLLVYIGVTLLLGASVATVGGSAAGYFWAFRSWSLIVMGLAAVAAVQAVSRRRPPRGPGAHWAVEHRHPLVLGGLCVVMLAASWSAWRSEQRYVDRLAASPNLVFVNDLGGYLDRQYLPLLEFARTHRAEGVVEEYFGLVGATNGPLPALHVDAVIHALGEQRVRFQHLLETDPPLVVSTMPSMSPMFVSWGLSANWWFYRELFRTYVPAQSSPTTLTWKLAAPGTPWPDIPCSIGSDGRTIQLDNGSPGMYEVTVGYRGPDGGRAYAQVRNNISIAIFGGYVVLDPHATEQRFPVVAPFAGRTTLDVIDVPAGSAETRFNGCSARRVVPAVGSAAMDVYGSFVSVASTPVDLTDDRWIHGVARSWAGFFVPNSLANQAAFAAGNQVAIDGQPVRTVLRADQNGDYLNVFVDGEPLDAPAAPPSLTATRPGP